MATMRLFLPVFLVSCASAYVPSLDGGAEKLVVEMPNVLNGSRLAFGAFTGLGAGVRTGSSTSGGLGGIIGGGRQETSANFMFETEDKQTWKVECSAGFDFIRVLGFDKPLSKLLFDNGSVDVTGLGNRLSGVITPKRVSCYGAIRGVSFYRYYGSIAAVSLGSPQAVWLSHDLDKNARTLAALASASLLNWSVGEFGFCPS